MKQSALILYMPVIHQGYVRLLESLTQSCQIYVLQPSLAADLLGIQADPATLTAEECKAFLEMKGWEEVQTLVANNRTELSQELASFSSFGEVHLVDDQVGRAINMLLQSQVSATKTAPETTWHTVFLRWDSDSVQQTLAVDVAKTTTTDHQKWMSIADKIAKKSSDWWRQVGSIAVKNNSEILQAYNQGMPDDHTPYQYGAVRDYVTTGSSPELANYIHSEQNLIALAAAQGLSLAGADLYVTHFPCPVCAKLIAKAGFKKVYFKTGSATLDGKTVLEQHNIELIQVILDTDD